jgi:hypothetical protein
VRGPSWAAAVLAALAWVAAAGCAGDGSEDAGPRTTAAAPTAATTTPAAAGAPAGRAAGLPCDAQQFLAVMRDEGGQFALSPAVLADLRPEGPAQCDAAFARQTFAGPPDAPGPYAALFGVRPDRSGWGLVSVNCLSSVSSGQRQVC